MTDAWGVSPAVAGVSRSRTVRARCPRDSARDARARSDHKLGRGGERLLDSSPSAGQAAPAGAGWAYRR